MANFIIKNCMNLIKKYKPELNETDLEIIQYGLHGLYLSLTKIVVLIIISYFLGQLKECLIFLLFFGIIRTNAYGLHTPKSWMCWITTIPLFLLLPWLSLNIEFNFITKIGLGVALIIYILKYSPADTKKRPIISKSKRLRHKILATLTAIIFVVFSFLTNNTFLANSLILSLALMCILISPITYKIFKTPYNNYLNYNKERLN